MTALRRLISEMPPWLSMLGGVLVAAVALGGLWTRVAYCEEQIEKLSDVPERLASIDTKLGLLVEGRITQPAPGATP